MADLSEFATALRESQDSNASDITKIVKYATEQLCADLCTKKGYSTGYELYFKNFEDEFAGKDILLLAGNPVKIYLNLDFAINCFVNKKTVIFKDRLDRGLEKVRQMTRTLSNNLNPNLAIELKSDSKRWDKVIIPWLSSRIATKYLNVVYTVSVEDTVSGISISLHGDNPASLREEAIRRISEQIYERADIEDLIETFTHSKDLIVDKVSIGGGDNESRVKIEYNNPVTLTGEDNSNGN